MLGLALRNEFLGSHMPGTAISLRTADNQGAAQKPPEEILSITYPTNDVLTALRAIGQNRSGRTTVLIGDRGRGKSHIMAVMHHAIQTPDIIDQWMRQWGVRLGMEEMKTFEMTRGFFPITEPVHNHEYVVLWDLLFDRHPRGDFYRGQFELLAQPFPPRTLLEKMFAEQPTCLILDEFQTWYTGLPEKDHKTGYLLKQWAFNFVQILSEIAKDRPEILILVISVLDNQNQAFQQVHRQGPVLVDFRGPTAKEDRQRLVLHRLFENRRNIAETDIENLVTVYADERFRLRYSDKSDSERGRIFREVLECWPFSPELLDLLEDHILMSQAAQETRDLIRILAQVYRSRGTYVPIITPADFFVDGDTDEVQSLVDAIASDAGQERLRQIAQRNLMAVRDSGAAVPNARELISSIWMRSMSPGKTAGGTPNDLQLDITRSCRVDDNAFQVELALLIENSINIHGDEVPSGPLWFTSSENARTKVRAFAKNSKLWQSGSGLLTGQIAYPGKDIEHIRKTLRHVLVSETQEQISRVIILGPNWRDDPWSEVEEVYRPTKWDRPILLVVPDPIESLEERVSEYLGAWLKTHVTSRRNTVRFLLLSSRTPGLYADTEMMYAARCSFLCSKEAWGTDPTYRSLAQDFDRPLRQTLAAKYNRVAVLHTWNFQQTEKCIFEIETINAQGTEIPAAVESKILSDLFDHTEFRKYVLKRATDSDFVGSLLDDLIEPPVGQVLPYLGDVKTYEAVLDIVASGDIVLNVVGVWVGRRPEDATIEDARRYIERKAFRTGLEMRAIQLGLPNLVGGGTIAANGPAGEQPESGSTQPDAGNNGSTDYTHGGNGGQPCAEGGVEGGLNANPHLPNQPVLQVRQSEEPANGINLSGCFEAWGVPSAQILESARIEFSGLTAQQVKQILQRIPSTFKANLAIKFKEGDLL